MVFVNNSISNLPASSGAFIILDETYANGDGTDSWCTTNEQLPLEMHYQHIYPEPKCDVWSCGIGHLEIGNYYCVRLREDTAETVELLRIKLGFGITDAAEILGVDASTLTRLMSSTSRFKAD